MCNRFVINKIKRFKLCWLKTLRWKTKFERRAILRAEIKNIFFFWNQISTHVIDLDWLSLTEKLQSPVCVATRSIRVRGRFRKPIRRHVLAGLARSRWIFFSSLFFFFFLYSAITIVIASTCARRSPINWPDNGCYYYITFRDGYSCHVRRVARAKFGGRHAIGWHRCCRTFANPAPPSPPLPGLYRWPCNESFAARRRVRLSV